ncbi:glycosyltransferase [Pseudonocardia sp. DSM 110487]|uniref:glycosyltransferase n=1 Tax=Pseudonocardia sp. DSM 110487 TaxID=2865833 RepID=UPI001C698194|nr:glycosyltransferase [Pseudonocardia sp. DSM 110487]QYN38278.1 glycosyltransferase [Pseudonocardia sp. DSM 110487]
MPTTIQRPPVPAPRLPADASRPATIGILSTYPPTQCGLATFSAALTEQLNRGAGTAGVVRIVDRAEPYPGAEVAAHMVNGSPSSAVDAVRRLNGFGAVVVQHEYGIYGGADGCDVIDIVAGLTVPTIIVLHTVLQEPTSRQRRILRWLVESADIVVTMTETARQRLVASYGANPDAVVVIPHGANDHGPLDLEAARAERLAADRPLVLTWGLLGPGKGIEWAIDSLPGLQDLRPHYLVIGKTHPKVVERDGEEYRQSLALRAHNRGVADVVELDDRYLEVGELADLVQRADVVLLPYDSHEQVTSGVLIEAVAAGRPVVSTAFPHAVELLGDGTGLVVPQRDAAAMEAALRRALGEPGLADGLAERAARKAPDLLWGAVAARYQQIAESLVAAPVSTS